MPKKISNIRRLLNLMEEEEAKFLETKTSFGRNELKLLLSDSKTDAMERLLTELEEGNGCD